VTVHLANLTTGVATSFVKNAPGMTEAAGLCAEWIVERPDGTINGHKLNLGQYGSVYFSDCFAGTRAGTNLHPDAGDLVSMVDPESSPVSIPVKLGENAFKVDFTGGGGQNG
jgi:Peptidase A4 family